MSESNPLAGLTADEADAHIDRYQAKVDHADENLKAQKAHLKEMKAARKSLEEPVPVDEQGPNVTANAQPAEVTVEGGQL